MSPSCRRGLISLKLVVWLTDKSQCENGNQDHEPVGGIVQVTKGFMGKLQYGKRKWNIMEICETAEGSLLRGL